MLDEKSKGKEITVAPQPPHHGLVIDLMEALKRSMAGAGKSKAPAKKLAASTKTKKRVS